MPIFTCGHCGQPIDADPTLAGIEVRCPRCRVVLKVPGQAPYQPYAPPMYAQQETDRPPTHASQYSSAPDKWRIWAPALGTLAAFVLCLFKKLSEPTSSLDVALGNTDFASRLGGAIGYALAAGIFAFVVALIIAGIAAACQKSFLTVLTRSYGIGIVCASLLMIAGSKLQPRNERAPTPQANKNTREELNKLQEDIQKMQSGVLPTKGTQPPKTETPLADDAGDAEKLVVISRQYFEEIASLQKSYTDEMNKLGFSRLLDTTRVTADTNFSESYTLLASARVLVKDYGAKIRQAVGGFPARIRASNLNPRSRESHAQSAEKGTQEALISLDENWALEASCIDHITTIIDLLKARRGHWDVYNNQFIFHEPSDSEVFYRAMGKINQVVARQKEIQQKGAQNTEKVFDDLRSVLPK